MLVGSSIRRVVNVASDLGMFDDVQDFVEDDQFPYISADELVIILTGSQGENRAALAKIAKQEHRHRQELKEARKEHTLNYWNLVPLPELRPDETPVQTIIPLWEAGFMAIEEVEEEPALAGSGIGFS